MKEPTNEQLKMLADLVKGSTAIKNRRINALTVSQKSVSFVMLSMFMAGKNTKMQPHKRPTRPTGNEVERNGMPKMYQRIVHKNPPVWKIALDYRNALVSNWHHLYL